MWHAVCLLMAASLAAEAGVVKVVLVDNQSGQPLAHTRVTLQRIVPAGQAPEVKTVFTGKFGEYTFPDVSAGTYILSARKQYYAEARYGQKSWRHPGLPFHVAADQEFVALIRMNRLGVITGEAVDENRIGLPGVPVFAFRSGVRLRVAGRGESDDRGMFRIPGLLPGRYLVQTGGTSVDDRSLLPTFFGQTVRAYDARPTEAQIESETAGAYIEPLPGKLMRLRVSTVAPPDVTVTVSLYTDGGKRDVTFQGPGVATYNDLAPGTYDVLVRAAERPPTASYRRVQVARDDEEIAMQLSPAPVWNLGCLEKGGRKSVSQQAGFQVLVRRKMPQEEEWQPLPCGKSYTTPGLWEIAAAAPPEWYVAGIGAQRGEDAYEVNIMDGRPQVFTEVYFGRDGGQVKGLVKGRGEDSAAAVPVFLIPLDRELRMRTGYKAFDLRADLEGKFWFQSVPPGRYAVVASWEQAEVDVREWVAQGTEATVSVEAGSVSQVEVGIRQN